MPLFPTSIGTIIFVSVFVLYFLAEIVGSTIVPMLRRRREKVGVKKKREYLSTLLIDVSAFVSILIIIKLILNNMAMLPDWFFYPGIVLMVMGIIVRQWAIFTLGRSFTSVVIVQKNQKVVDYGLYRYIRHPAYLGLYMFIVGIGVALQSWGAILVLGVLFGLALGYRIYIEEKLLVSELGDDYIQYMKRTKRLIPFVI